MGLLCRPLQRDSGSLRLPLPGEAGLEILYQPQRTWFPSRSKSGFVLFFLSFFLSLPSSLPLSLGLVGFPVPPCTSWRPLPLCSLPHRVPPRGGAACRAAEGHGVAHEGTIPASPVLEEPEDPGGAGHLGAHPTCRSLNPIPAQQSGCLFPSSSPDPAKGRSWRGGIGGAGPGDAHRHAWKGSMLPERSSPGVNKQPGEGPGSSRPGSDVSQPRWCQEAPDVPGWGNYQPKPGGNNEYEREG